MRNVTFNKHCWRRSVDNFRSRYSTSLLSQTFHVARIVPMVCLVPTTPIISNPLKAISIMSISYHVASKDNIVLGRCRVSRLLTQGMMEGPILLRRVISARNAILNPRNFSSSTKMHQNRLPAAYYRGGTSRAIMFQSKDLPADRSRWNSIFLGVLGSPDPNGRQLDGLGGGISSLSKICIVGPSTKPEADVDYTFVAIGVKDAEVDFSSNCGNMSSAIGPFAVDSRIVDVGSGKDSKEVTVRIHNTNTGKLINSTFPVVNGEASAYGTFEIDGVGGKAATVQLDFVKPAGSKTGKLLPTGNVVDEFDGVQTTCVDVGNPCCFVRASSLNVPGNLTPDQIEKHPTLLKSLDSIRCQAAVKMGLAKTESEVPGSIPKICMVSPTSDTAGQKADITVRAISVGQPHKAVPITVALSTAAAAKILDSTVQGCLVGDPVDPVGITLGHASGKLTVQAHFGSDGQLNSATVFRTARRLMEGTVFWK